MIFKENDIVISIKDINEGVKKDTIGVILSILKENEIFLVEFIDQEGSTIGDGMETVTSSDIIIFSDS